MIKGLDALKKLGDVELHNPFLEEPRLIKTKNSKAYGKEYKIIEKELKVLEILRKYIIDTKKLMLVTTTNPYFYNNFGEVGVIPITQEEYDLLKEVLL